MGIKDKITQELNEFQDACDVEEVAVVILMVGKSQLLDETGTIEVVSNLPPEVSKAVIVTASMGIMEDNVSTPKEMQR